MVSLYNCEYYIGMFRLCEIVGNALFNIFKLFPIEKNVRHCLEFLYVIIQKLKALFLQCSKLNFLFEYVFINHDSTSSKVIGHRK